MPRNIKKRSVLTEAQEQNAVARYLDSTGMLWSHVPNERSDAIQRFRLKKAGVKPGVPDIFIYTTPHPFYGKTKGTAIELKRRDGVPSDVSTDQWWWLNSLMENGWLVYVAFGAKDAVRYIREVYSISH